MVAGLGLAGAVLLAAACLMYAVDTCQIDLGSCDPDPRWVQVLALVATSAMCSGTAVAIAFRRT